MKQTFGRPLRILNSNKYENEINNKRKLETKCDSPHQIPKHPNYRLNVI